MFLAGSIAPFGIIQAHRTADWSRSIPKKTCTIGLVVVQMVQGLLGEGLPNYLNAFLTKRTKNA